MAILSVSNQAQLVQAIKDVRSGDTIKLAAGTYDNLEMNANSWNPHLKFTQKVTITSADPDNPAVINRLMTRNVENLELTGLKFDYNPTKSDTGPFWIESGKNISVKDSDFVGETVGLYGAGTGLRIKSGQNISVEDSTFTNFRNGLYASNGTNVDILRNEFTKMSNDGMLMGGMVDMLIQGNDLRDMKSDPNLQHKDGIQFLTSDTEAGSRDIIVRGNVIVNGEATHGIYFTNPEASDDGDLSVVYRNILIEENYLRVAHVHGITVNHGDGVIIRNNELVRNPDLGYTEVVNVPRINVSTLSKNVSITGNTVVSVQSEADASWNVTNNHTERVMSHWIGIGATIGPPDTGNPGGGGDNQNEGNGIAQDFRIDGRKAAANPVVTFENVDFTEGDNIIFNFYEANTFRQVNDWNPMDVFNNGGAVKMNEIHDLVELVRESADVTARTISTGDTLILTILQDIGSTDVRITGFGSAYDDLI